MRYVVWLVMIAISGACGSQSSQSQEKGILLQGAVENYNPSMFVHFEMLGEEGMVKKDTLLPLRKLILRIR